MHNFWPTVWRFLTDFPPDFFVFTFNPFAESLIHSLDFPFSYIHSVSSEFLRVWSLASSISILWRLVRNASPWSPPRPNESETLEIGGPAIWSVWSTDFLSFFFFKLFRSAPTAYGNSQARGQIGTVAAGHGYSHSRSKPRLQLTLQLMATLDPQPTEQGQGSNPHPNGY